MSVGQRQAASAPTLQQPLPTAPAAPIVNPEPTNTPAERPARRRQAVADGRRAARIAEHVRDEAEPCAKLAALPVRHEPAAGSDVGDASHGACVEATPDDSDSVRAFPAHTPGLRQLVAWLQKGVVTPIALEATGVYGHVLYLTLREAGFGVIPAPPPFARPIKGRPKTDRRDGPWIQRWHKLGRLPSIFQPNEATHALRDYVRQRANLVRLSGQHIQRMPKALESMNLKLTKVLGDITGVTGLKVIRALRAGERDPTALARRRDRRCGHTAAEMAQALDGRSRPESMTALRCCLILGDKYQEVIAALDGEIAGPLRSMRRPAELPPLPPRGRVRGRQPHDPRFDVRTALYYAIGVDLTAIAGIDELHALTLVSALGSDLTKGPTVQPFRCWLGLCPNWPKTAGKVKSSRVRRGKNRAARALRRAAWSLMRSKSYLGAYLRRQRSRLGAPKAITATAHKLARIVYHVVRYGVASLKQTEAADAEQVRQRLEKQWHRRAKERGLELKQIETAPEMAAE